MLGNFFVYLRYSGVQHIVLCFCFVFRRLDVPYVATFSGLSIFECPFVFSNVYLFGKLQMYIRSLHMLAKEQKGKNVTELFLFHHFQPTGHYIIYLFTSKLLAMLTNYHYNRVSGCSMK